MFQLLVQFLLQCRQTHHGQMLHQGLILATQLLQQSGQRGCRIRKPYPGTLQLRVEFCRSPR